MTCPEAALKISPFVLETEEALDPDPAHSGHVASLALAIFDALVSIHGYGPAERRLLEIAARLHDIGWSQARGVGHHKMSARIIRKTDIPGLSEKERDTCALIARYHTKALPNATRHRRFARLEGGQRTLVEWLAGILRVADALDSSHERAVSSLTCDIGKKTVKIRLVSSTGDCGSEIERAAQKQSLLVKRINRDIEYQCR